MRTGIHLLILKFLIIGSLFGCNSPTVDLTGGPAAATGSSAAPNLISSPGTASYGSVTSGTTTSLPITITNTGSATATIGSITYTGSAFTTITNTCSNGTAVALNASCAISVQFAPTAVTSYVNTLTISYTDPSSKSYSLVISLSGLGISSVTLPTLVSSPSSMNFGTVATNVSASQTFTLSNSSGVSASTQAASIGDSNYKITSNNCNNINLTGGGTCAITVAFSPTSNGTHSTTLSISYLPLQGGSSQTLNVSLTGQGTTPTVNFTFAGVTSYSGLTGSGATINWNLATGGTPAYYVIYSLTGGVTTPITINNVSLTSYAFSTLNPGTTYVVGINAYSSLNVSDGNTATVTFTTPAISATFNGWTDVVSVGSVVTSAYTYNTSLSSTNDTYTGAPDLALNAEPTGAPGGAAGDAVELAWNAMTLSSSSITSYNVWRSTTANPVYPTNFTLVGNTGSTTPQYIDTTVSDNTYYYYVIHPVATSDIIPTIVTDSVISVYVPPSNMALVHRWMVNLEACTNLLGGLTADRTNNYRCTYSWGTISGENFGAGSESYWDIGYSFVVDRWENGCNINEANNYLLTSSAISAPSNATGVNGDIYYEASSTGNGGYGGTAYGALVCYLKKSGTWYAASSASLTNSDHATMTTNQPGYFPFNASQSFAFGACHSRTISGVGSERLLRLPEKIAASAWNGVFWNPSSGSVSTYVAGGTLPTSQGCNTNNANGVNSNGAYYIPADASFNNDEGQEGALLISGSWLTRSCQSRYGVQDLIGNQMESLTEVLQGGQTSGSMSFLPSTSNGYDVNTDVGYGRLDNFIFDGTMGPLTTTQALYTFSKTAFTDIIPMLGLPTVSASATLGSVALSSTYLRSNDYTVGNNNATSSVMTGYGGGSGVGGTADGRFAWQSVASPTNTSIFPTGGFRCAATVLP